MTYSLLLSAFISKFVYMSSNVPCLRRDNMECYRCNRNEQ
jgi:hypothetical protein